MLEPIDENLWHAVHRFRSLGIAVTSRMTVVRLTNGSLWLHAPIPISPDLRKELDALGPVQFIVAPNLFHHMFAGLAAQAYPRAVLFGAPGLRRKRTDLKQLQELGSASQPIWQSDLEEVLVEGLPMLSESVWFHRGTATLIVTDILQWTQGDVPWSARLYAQMQGVRRALAVPRTLRWAVRDPMAVRRAFEAILRWPIKRLIIAHNMILGERDNAAQQVRTALEAFIARL